MRVILDTGVFYRPESLKALTGQTPIVPAVVYLERLRQLRRDGRSEDEFNDVLAGLRMVVEPFGREQAARVPKLSDADWRRLARDAMIAGHLKEGDMLWTTNPKDFLALGIPARQIIVLP